MTAVTAASNVATKVTKKRRAPPPPAAQSIEGASSQQILDKFPGINNDVGRSVSNVPNTLER